MWSDRAVSANSNYSSVLDILARSAQSSGLRNSHGYLVSSKFYPVAYMPQGRARDTPGVLAAYQLKVALGVLWSCREVHWGVRWEPELLARFQRLGISCWP